MMNFQPIKIYSWNYVAGIGGNYHEFSNCFEYPTNTCHNFPPKKIPKLKISNPEKSFDYPCHLKSGVPALWSQGQKEGKKTITKRT